MKLHAKLTALALALLLAIAVLGCTRPAAPTENTAPTAPAQSEASAGSDQPAELTKVRIGVLPYFDYTLFVAAKELGLDKEMGLDFELVSFTLEGQAAQALLNGSIDIAQGALGSFVPLMPEAQDLRVFMTNNQYTGFLFVGRKGEYKSFDTFYAELGEFAAAQKATLEQFSGATFCMVESSFASMLNSTMELIGLTYEDTTVMNFSNDAQAAMAFMTGEGDFYTGSTTQITKLLQEPDKYEIVAGAEVLGAAGLWYSNSATSVSYLNDHKDILLKVMAVHYKAAELLANDPDTVIPSMIKYLRENASSDMTMESAKEALSYSVDFYSLTRAKETVFNPENEIYWRPAGEKYLNDGIALGNIPEGSVDLDTMVVQDELFQEFLANAELVAYVNP